MAYILYTDGIELTLEYIKNIGMLDLIKRRIRNMSRKAGVLKNYSRPKRLSFPGDEKDQDWLSPLLDSYFTADKAIFDSILKEEKKGRILACSKGCSSCCSTHITIPLYPLEIMGIYWYVIMKLDKEKQLEIKKQLEAFKPGKGCPFLVGGGCGIHPMRPLACRHFNVFDKSCKEGEDPFYSRRKDVLIPDEKLKTKALSMLLSFHGISNRKDRREYVLSGKIHDLARNLQEVEWIKLAKRIDGIES